ncbi:hypothetical protein L7F22_048599 [Adiantum nelumboides]|nr:hypothetical protein [Adiantum nelumboides]
MASSSSSDFYTQHDMPPEQYTLNRVMGVIIVVFFVSMLFILMFNLYIRCLGSSYSTSSLFAVHGSTAPLPQRVDRSPPQHHGPVASGLDKATIAQLPTSIYRAQETTGRGPHIREKNEALLDCAICLSEFLDKEKGRWLPSCKHAFHIECIDMWFCSHSTCPLCRTDVVPIKGDKQIPQTPMEESTDFSQEYNGPVAVQNEPKLDVSQSPVIDIFNCNQTRIVTRSNSVEDPSCLHSPSTHISIDIPIARSSSILGPAPPLDQDACSSHPMRSLNGRLSFRRMLSRESSCRQRNSNLESFEQSPKTLGLPV